VADYAAELRREEGLNFSVRVGINSGEVVAGAIGAGSSHGDYTAIGHTVGLAQRMEALAEPGKAYLTESTAELAAGFLELDDLGEFEIKGASRPVRVHELAGVGDARSRLDLSRQRGFSRFVGRREEIEAFEEAMRRAEAGEGAVVGVVAEAGTGKSRLCSEFAERSRGRGIEVFEAQAQSHGSSVPYLPILQMLRAFFGIGEREDEQLAREKIAGRALLLDPGFAEDLPLLFDFLGVPDPGRPVGQISPEARQRALEDVVCRLAHAPARTKTLVLLVEDLHWIDEGSEAMLRGLVESIAGTNTLAIVNFRPEYEPAWSGSSTYREISLQPLGQADTRELLRDLAGEDPSLDGLDEPIHTRTQGNPFFIEEIVRELAEAGQLEGERGSYRLRGTIEGTPVPVTVQAVLAARIDRLSPAAKRLVQTASVLGKEVGRDSLGLTAELEDEELEPGLDELIAGGFLFEAELYPERRLAFRHPLTREVAYGTQLAESRAATHAAAARALIELDPERLDELAPLVADHFAQGGEQLEAARWFARAAHRAGHTRPQDALRLWQRVTELSKELDESEEVVALAISSRMLQLEYAWRLGMDRSVAEALEAEATELAERSGDVASLALLKLLAGARPGIATNADEWVAAAAEATELADSTGDPNLRVAVRSAGAYAQICAGDLEGIETTVDELIELTGGDSSVGAGIVVDCPLAWGPMAKAMVMRERDRVEEAEGLADQALRVAIEHDDPETESWALGTKSSLLADRGEIEAALTLGRRNRELTERLGDVFSRSTALTSLAYVLLASEQPEEALETVELSDRIYREAMGVGGEGEAWRGILRAKSLLALGREEEALEAAEWASETAVRRGMGWQTPPAFLILAQARHAVGAEGVEAALAEATERASGAGHTMSLRRIEAERDALTAV
jgi:adenylate cyclase